MLEEILSHFDENQKFSRDFTVHQVIKALFEYETVKPAMESLGQRGQVFNTNIKKLLPGVRLAGKQTWKAYFIEHFSNYKKCTSCKEHLQKESFGLDTNRPDNLNNKCKSCDKTRVANRKATILNAIPPWADLSKIAEIYANCPKGYHVDHILPLQGENSCGLHVETNLQYLTAKDNVVKGNRI